MLRKLINFIFIFLVIAVAILLIIDTIKINPKSIAKKLIQDSDLEAKERNFFVKYLKIIPLGTAALKNLGIEKYKGKDVYHLMAEAYSLPNLSTIFKAEAKVDSFIDIKELHSLAFLQHLEVSNKPDEDKEIVYDQNKNIMRIKDEERVILPHSQDPLSAIFFIQQQRFHIGKSIVLYLNTNQKNYDLTCRIKKKQEITIGGQKFGLWLLEADIKRHDKSPRHSSSLKIWFLENLDNNEKVPILIKAMTNIGPITAYLVNLQ